MKFLSCVLHMSLYLLAPYLCTHRPINLHYIQIYIPIIKTGKVRSWSAKMQFWLLQEKVATLLRFSSLNPHFWALFEKEVVPRSPLSVSSGQLYLLRGMIHQLPGHHYEGGRGEGGGHRTSFFGQSNTFPPSSSLIQSIMKFIRDFLPR